MQPQKSFGRELDELYRLMLIPVTFLITISWLVVENIAPSDGVRFVSIGVTSLGLSIFIYIVTAFEKGPRATVLRFFAAFAFILYPLVITWSSLAVAVHPFSLIPLYLVEQGVVAWSIGLSLFLSSVVVWRAYNPRNQNHNNRPNAS